MTSPSEQQSAAAASLDSLLSLLPDGYGNRSWVELVEEEEARNASFSESQDSVSDVEEEQQTNSSIFKSNLQQLVEEDEESNSNGVNSVLKEKPSAPDEIVTVTSSLPASSRVAPVLHPETPGSSRRKMLVPHAIKNVRRRSGGPSPSSSGGVSAPKIARRFLAGSQPSTPSTSPGVGFIFRQSSDEVVGEMDSDSWEFCTEVYKNVPNNGWCSDKKTLIRRSKDLNRMKEREVYAQYIAEVPKGQRVTGVHPKTPTKYVNHTRRSWDMQVKLWKRAIYNWAGLTPPPSAASSYCNSECSESEDNGAAMSTDVSPTKSDPEKRVADLNEQDSKSMVCKEMLQDVTITLQNTDTIASLFGHFDMDTRAGESTLMMSTGCNEEGTMMMGQEESTLKAAPVAIPTATTTNESTTSRVEIGTTKLKSYASAVMTDFSQMKASSKTN